MNEKVLVRVSFYVGGQATQDIEMTPEEFDRLDRLPDRSLSAELDDRINWGDVEARVAGCDEFVILAGAMGTDANP